MVFTVLATVGLYAAHKHLVPWSILNYEEGYAYCQKLGCVAISLQSQASTPCVVMGFS